jgi:ABC-type antimicrobial peptide transport system permease subunit
VRGVLTGALAQTAIGLLIGIPAAFFTVNVIGTFLYEVQARDPRVIATAAIVLLVSAVAAGIAPALRASRINPNVALRAE